MFDLDKYQLKFAAVTSAAIGAATSGYQIYQGIQEKKQAQRALNEFQPQDLVNPYLDMPISTVGSDYMMEQASINNANMVEAARNGGSRGIFTAIPQIVKYNNDANREVATYLDNQITERNYAIAGDQKAIRQIQENRDAAELEGIGTAIESGRQNMWAGTRGAGASAMYAANNIDWSNPTPDVKSVNSLKPIGTKSSATASLSKIRL